MQRSITLPIDLIHVCGGDHLAAIILAYLIEIDPEPNGWRRTSEIDICRNTLLCSQKALNLLASLEDSQLIERDPYETYRIWINEDVFLHRWEVTGPPKQATVRRVIPVDRQASVIVGDAGQKSPLASLTPLGREIVGILQKNNVNVSTLSENQQKTLKAKVYVAGNPEPLPSPEEEYTQYPVQFRAFLGAIPKMPQFKHVRLNATNFISALVHYGWRGGWNEYRPEETAPSDTTNGTLEWFT